MSTSIGASDAPPTDLLDTPRALAQVRVFFSRPSKADVRAAKELLGTALSACGKAKQGYTVISVRPPTDTTITPREVMAEMRHTFGHIKSYDGCDIAFENSDSEKQTS